MATETKPKSSLGCCLLKIFLALAAMFLLVVAIIIYNIYSVTSWVTNAIEPLKATPEPLQISAGESQDVDRIIRTLQLGRNNPEPIDERITPNVFNGVVDTIIQGERNNGKKPIPEMLRGGFDGDHFSIAFSGEAKDKGRTGYFNGRATFDLEIEDGAVTKAELHKLNLGGRDAPWTVLWAANNFVLKKLQRPNDAESMHNAKGFKVFKLLKRDGDRLHIILDPTEFKNQNMNMNVPAPPPPGDKPAGKTEF